MSKKSVLNTKAQLDPKDLPVKTLSKSDFAWVDWQPKHFRNFPNKAISELKNDYDVIKKIPSSERTFENTVCALEQCGREYGQKIHYVGFLSEVSPKKSVREMAHKVTEEFSHLIVDVVYDEGIYRALCEYAEKKEKLHGEDKILFDDTMRGYRRMGFGLPKRKQEVLKKNLKELSRLSITFRKNINDYKDYITLTADEAIGLSNRFLSSLKKDSRGRYLVSLEYPEIGPFLENSPNDLKRKEIVDKNARKGGPANIKLLKRIIALRQANAKLLDYKTFAHYAIEERMAKTPENVMKFLNSIVKKVEKGAQNDKNELLSFKREFTKNPRVSIEYYDSYYVNQLQKQKYSVDSEKIREYFPFEKVREGVFGTYQKLFSVKFERVLDYPLWHPDVELYAITENKKILAYFSMDLFPRDGKYGHAAAFDLIDGRVKEGHYIAPLAALVCNFSKPSKENPSLLSHDEVETFFHEFGHIMHDVLTKTRYESQAGFHVAWDFVEMPSQMLENWGWNKDILRKISGHYKTNARLPEMLITNMLRAQKFRISTMYLRQMLLSLFDMKLHFERAPGAPQEIYRQMVKDIVGHTLPKTQLFPAGFGHIVGGYEAGYYSYAWAKVYAQDMFTRFESEGILNTKTGNDYRTWILEKGGSIDEMTLIKKFLGRAPNNKAFLKYISQDRA
ncbi:Zn-dependent oligopeptidase [Candidatus Kaiserbacteria bacterium]|nr:MAG: Zn-dependent oligopeptidase [Candidatus Kaiserbacteria bacterium]